MISAGLGFISGLPGGWTVRLSSGEPSAHPALIDIVRGISRLGQRVAMESNLSLPLERYLDFVSAAGPQLAYLHVSLHLDETPLQDFVEKCRRLRDRNRSLGTDAELIVATVARPDRLRDIEAAAQVLRKNGFSLVLQAYFDMRSRTLADMPSKASLLAARSCLEEAVEFNSGAAGPRGRLCAAGLRWLLLDFKGDVWRCQQALRESRAPKAASEPALDGHLGNLLRGRARLSSQAAPCPYSFCPCPGHVIA
jgi:hypothetical protein